MSDNLLRADLILLHGGEVVDPNAGEPMRADMVIRNGKIDQIGLIDPQSFNGKVYEVSGCWITLGLFDMHVHLREPGREDEETIESGCDAAAAGGFTGIACMPNTSPPCDSQEVVRFIKKKAQDEPTEVYPIAALTKGRQGKEITEMADLVRAGAVAFSDDGSPVADTSVMRNAMDYAFMFDVPIIDHCEDPFLAQGGHMNEGLMSTRLGLPGIPNAAEAVQIARDILLCRLTGAKVHIAHLSTQEGVELVRRAKEAGLPVTAEVTPHHLFFTDADLATFDTNLKMNPPLRTSEDVEALEQGLREGVIDAFASDHAPHSLEEKDVEFDAAPFGIIGLETMLGVIFKQIVGRGVLTAAQALQKMIISPRKILGLPIPKLSEGQPAELTIFHPTALWTFDKTLSRSKSRNTPYHGMEFPAKVWGIINKGMVRIV
ncbi:MAG: dihydroorotase [candidate division KSB1 bacterium]|nr:dihydroorotase [candidate division KSB1 bacterium]